MDSRLFSCRGNVMADTDRAVFFVNGKPFPPPKRGLSYVVATNVDTGRNANGEVVGQKVGRDVYKLDSMEWPYLKEEVWASMLQEFKDFYVTLTFWDMVNSKWISLKAYPGNRSAEPYWLDEGSREHSSGNAPVGWYGDLRPIAYVNCKVNLIDCGIIE